ncbi:CU044_2847 family protein [Streptomyces sp. NBS 14/10]|uniref:CU044_2847 family protein n=1 Tax=Streptomyces sp. NBS 14/10 TaxID=1945643 RepID=UPI000B7E6165|nr:CU044_2847 family protein [Streptomyces sp. NBS 14/10]KAK1184406.1 CU044_2847 family protein [Streptomyces sp. NBS 14/10]
MPGSVRMPLEDGGAILFEDVEGVPESDGPVKAGRLGDAVRELPRTVQESLIPVRETARAVLEQLRAAGPQEVEVEFGVNLSAKAGAVITSGEAAVHLKVRLVWSGGDRMPPTPESAEA